MLPIDIFWIAWYAEDMKKGTPKKDWDPKFLRSMIIFELCIFIYLVYACITKK